MINTLVVSILQPTAKTLGRGKKTIHGANRKEANAAQPHNMVCLPSLFTPFAKQQHRPLAGIALVKKTRELFNRNTHPHHPV
jgi:hypothetical protein